MSWGDGASQKGIDKLLQPVQSAASSVQPYDFRRPDRIPSDQLHAIEVLHENFGREVASSLSAYLRAYVTVSLISVEQLAFVEFTQSLAAPTVVMVLGLKPYEGKALLEVSPVIAFPIIEMLLGGRAQGALESRALTEIEQNVFHSVFRIVLHDLNDAWQAVTDLTFNPDGYEAEPQLLQILAPHEAVVSVSMELRIGEVVGMLNLAIPSVIIRMLRQKFSEHAPFRKANASEGQEQRMLRLVQASELRLDARLSGASASAGDLLRLSVGEVISFDHPVSRPLDMEINGRRKFQGHIAQLGQKRAFVIS